LKQALWDYTDLLDRYIGDESHHQETKSPPAFLRNNDLTDWIVTFQAGDQASVDHALSRWESTKSVPWLIAALAKVDAANVKAALLQQAAAQIPPSSPAFPLAAYHRVRVEIAAGRTATARAHLDELLNKQRSRFNISSINLLEQQRMLVSTSVDDFLAHAQQVPAAFSWNDDGREIPADAEEVSDSAEAKMGKPFFNPASSAILNQRLAVAVLAEAANSKRLPEHLRRDVAQAAWLRAALLGNHSTATALAPTLKALVPDLEPFLNAYTAAPDPAAKKFAAINAWLHFPGMEPVIDTGSGRGGALNEQDSYRDNWWCGASVTPATEPKQIAVPAFLTAAQVTIAQKEFATLSSLGTAPNFISQQVLAWATQHPADQRVPEALHLAVKTTRYGCTDKQSGRWSKAAYDFLHRRYPGNAWTKQTPYWFKE
jgi:hypothetical protein